MGLRGEQGPDQGQGKGYALYLDSNGEQFKGFG